MKLCRCLKIDNEEYYFDLDDFDDDMPLTYGRVRELGVWDELFNAPDDGTMEDTEQVKLEGYRNCYVSPNLDRQ